MLLDHLTSRNSLPAILQAGLLYGRAPLSADRAVNAVWPTSEPGPEGHGLEQGEPAPVARLARRNLPPEFLVAIHPAGASLRQAKTWRLYSAVILPGDFAAVDLFDDQASNAAERGRRIMKTEFLEDRAGGNDHGPQGEARVEERRKAGAARDRKGSDR